MGRSNFTFTNYSQQILQPEDIPTQWNSSILINIDKGHQDKEKLDNKKGISLTSNIAKLFEKIIINILNSHLKFTEAQPEAQPGKNTLSNLLALKSVIQQRMIQKSRNTCCFYRLRKCL